MKTKKDISKSSVSLYAILARKVPVAVIFRRGPSKQVLLIYWKTNSDEFYIGQWLKGRIYPEACDLSPMGDKLLYFAGKFKGKYDTWTAVSRPPFLTALALWPKGDCWGGGGLFKNENIVIITHRPNEMKLAEGSIPKKIKIECGWSQKNKSRLVRDGWVIENQYTIRKRNQVKNHKYELINEMADYRIVDINSQEKISLGRLDWAEWDYSGDLVYAKQGKIYRLSFDRKNRIMDIKDAKMLIDLSSLKFETRETPEDAKKWFGKLEYLEKKKIKKQTSEE
ncbi:hypothetical protein KKF81_06235 [Candidatus Micrarchaeota archaeon]|nr:hypothetical protein [Candidatus Micrarchaeota archaeon]MBU1166528.1 hypothetical protein [Candidatus Micrarchaeota archaeon]MBU1887540.1 hypothetical protein [Candidatus Micrarchaeota archaeon]